jgi:hypothetical protein
MVLKLNRKGRKVSPSGCRVPGAGYKANQNTCHGAFLDVGIISHKKKPGAFYAPGFLKVLIC